MAKLKNTYQNNNAVVDATRTIAGLNLSQNITANELINILNTGAPGFGDKIVDKSFESADEGYIKFSSGLIIQWSYIKNINLTAANPETLPISFSSTNYVVCANTTGLTESTNLYAINCTPINEGHFYALASYYAQSCDACYIAIGV